MLGVGTMTGCKSKGMKRARVEVKRRKKQTPLVACSGCKRTSVLCPATRIPQAPNNLKAIVRP